LSSNGLQQVGYGMPTRDRKSFPSRSVRQFGRNVSRAGPAASAGYTLIGAIVLLGGLGYLADRYWGTSPWLVLTGLILGVVVGFYELAKVIWPR
jgi:F0F1-type ATP synthase assembly protein I